MKKPGSRSKGERGNKEKRKDIRFFSQLKARYILKGEEGGWKECTIINISRNGLGITFAIRENLSAGSSVHIETFPPGQMEPMKVEGEVRWFEPLSSGGFICGIKLTEKLNKNKFERLMPDASRKKKKT